MLEDLALPLLAPLPPLKDGDLFTPDQWATLISMCEVFIPSIPNSTGSSSIESTLTPYTSSPALIRPYLAESVLSDRLKEILHRRISLYVPTSQIQAFSLVLSALNSRAGLLIMTGGLTPLQFLSVYDRTKIICGWSQSYMAPLRALFGSIEALGKLSWLHTSPNLHKLTGFPIVPEHVGRNPSFEFEFADYASSTEDSIHLEYDIVIVGSGCGAGVLASHLARNTSTLSPRPRIVVLEKSYHFPTTHFPMTSDVAGMHLMESGGTLQSDDGSMAILAGSTWGGGGTVNWSASLQPQHFVRDEWEAKGLDFFTSAEFQDCLDTVCDRMGVARMTDEKAKSKIPQNFGNSVLLEGARQLGMTCEVVPQNSKGEAHWCGYCSEGCAGATKQGPANCWLPDAAKNGVDFIEGCFVHEILWGDSLSNRGRKARGVRATWTSRDWKTKKELVIAAPRVVVSGGTLSSPALLIRSEINSYHVGRNLHLHPTTAIAAVWREPVKPWDGPILTAAVTSFENADNAGHGPKIEMLAGTPTYMLPWTPWNPSLTLDAIKSGRSTSDPDAIFASALDYKIQCAKYAHTAVFIAIQRDRDTGRVYVEPKDPDQRQLRIEYTPSKHDRTCLVHGLIATCRIAYAKGAIEIRPYAVDLPPFIKSDSLDVKDNDAAFKTWLGQLKKIGVNAPGPCRLGSAHQMGTCRMSARKEEGVVNFQGKVWEVEGVYVCDASVFPSASGVNPMVTTMGIAEWIGREMVKELKRN